MDQSNPLVLLEHVNRVLLIIASRFGFPENLGFVNLEHTLVRPEPSSSAQVLLRH